ncbi:hypothetical protein B5P44_00825 [Mycobacterium sp. CBMA 213]|uniref:Uncharacterized protein n=1 Tax=Mycolicibacterium sp. CBMA 213 TaxID=1968788 RepID=A0A343VRF1_9MYCO|nr:hypothetical protein B5P44_p00180 [Mycolicibacterium sp. CBMA 213]MUM03366.1 hypothetical protein [Mycolicibacterium sp. CBMA 213]
MSDQVLNGLVMLMSGISFLMSARGYRRHYLGYVELAGGVKTRRARRMFLMWGASVALGMVAMLCGLGVLVR